MENLKEMVDYLWLTDELHWDLALYWIFLINVVMLFTLPDGSTLGTFIAIVVIIGSVIDKVFGFGFMLDPGRYTPEHYHAKIFIGTYLMRAVMFVGPLSVAGSTDSPKARFVGIIAGLSGGVYSFARWYFDQRDVSTTDIGVYLHWDMLAQSAGMTLLLARLALGRRVRLGFVHRNVPVTITRDLAAHDVEV